MVTFLILVFMPDSVLVFDDFGFFALIAAGIMADGFLYNKFFS